MSTANAKHPTFIGDYSPAKLWDIETIVECDFIRVLSIDVPKVDGLGAPLEIVHVLVAAVAFLQNKRVFEQLSELVNDIYFCVISNSAVELSQFPYLEHQILRNGVKLVADEFKGLEVPLAAILSEIRNIFPELVQLLN